MRRFVFVAVVALLAGGAVTTPALTQSAEDPYAPAFPPGHVEGTGTHFALADSEYLNIVLDSAAPITLTLDSVPEMVTIIIEPAEEAASTDITLTGFEPETTYHLYQDNYHNHSTFTTDVCGAYAYAQGLSTPHIVFIQPRESTIYLSSVGWSAPVGTWDPVTQTGTLTQDIFQTIQIDSDGVTLDGNGYRCDGSGSGSGVYMNGRTGVMVTNLTIDGFSLGIYLYNSDGNTISGNTVSVTSNGIMLSGCEGNVVENNTVSGGRQTGGIILWQSDGNTVSGNTTTGNLNGIYVGPYSDDNEIVGNETRLNVDNGMQLSHATGNVVSGNTISDNSTGGWNGIYMVSSPGNTIEDNEIEGNSGHGIAMWLSCSGNTIRGNTISDNGGAGVKFYVRGNHSNLIRENTFEHNGYGINFDAGYDWGPHSGNQVYNNNFIANTVQARGDVSGGGVNIFNLAAPTGGNYWSNWTSPDADSDGFVDNPFVFPAGQDNLPWTTADGWLGAADTTPPTTSVFLSGTSGSNGWYVSAVEVTLVAADDAGGSGVQATEYGWDGSTWWTCSGPFLVSTEGVSTLYYRSSDNAGNIEDPKTQTLKIDTTPPTISGAPTTAPNASGWFNCDVVVHFSASDAVSGIDTVTPDVTLTAEGAGQSVPGSATDQAGNSASTTVCCISIDKTPPQITISTPASEAEYLLHASVVADWSAADALSGLASVSGTVPSGSPLNTDSVGSHTFQVTAVDMADNEATQTHTYYVRYAYSGVLQPVNPDGSSIFKLGRTVPVKLQLTDATGAFVSDAIVQIYLAKISDGVVGSEIEASSTSAASTGNTFRYDAEANQYIFNLGTKGLSKGTWQIRLEVSDGASYYAIFSLR